MKNKIFIILGYQNFTDYFIEFSKHLNKKYKVVCLVFGYKNYLRVKENSKFFEQIYCYEELVDSFYKNKSEINYGKLKDIEKKIGSLWSMIYADRQLLDYFYDVDYGKKKLKYNDLLSFLYQWSDFFEKVFFKKDFKYLVSYSTASLPGFLSVKLAKEYEAKYLCFKTLGIPDRFTIIDDLDDKFLIKIDGELDLNWAKEFLKKFDDYEKPKWIKKRKKVFFLKRIKKIIDDISLEKKVFKFVDNNKTAYLNLTLQNILYQKIKKKFNTIYYNLFIKKNFKLTNLKYIYFPFHVEPESNLMIKNILNSNQITVLENLSKFCPIDFKLVVKDHPNQFMRSPQFYNRLKKIPNVIIADSKINSRELIKGAEAIFCISGTSILETLLLKKKLLVYGNNITIKNFFPQFKCDFVDLRKQINENKLPDEKDIINMLAYLKNISVDLDSNILVNQGDSELISKKLYELFKRVDEKNE